MQIILGVFFNEEDTYSRLAKKYDLLTFTRFWYTTEEHKPTNLGLEENVVITRVNKVLELCTECYFDLTSIEFSLTDYSFSKITILELYLVLTTPEYFEKTRFFVNCKEISKSEVFDKFIFNEYWNQFL